MFEALSKLASNFAIIADGEYGLKSHIRRSKDSMDVCFHVGGYVEFRQDYIRAVIENDRHIVWDLLPSDFDTTLKRFVEFVK